jgi:anti-sigma B factor antagonist
MQISEQVHPKALVLKLTGRLDAAAAPQLSKAIEKVLLISPSNLVVNMQEVSFIDSTGLSALVQGMKRCRERQGNLLICGLQQTVRIIFELTRLNKAFDIFIKEEDALHAFE